MLVVMIIISILMVLVSVLIARIRQRSLDSRTVAFVRKIDHGLQLYRQEYNTVPTANDGELYNKLGTKWTKKHSAGVSYGTEKDPMVMFEVFEKDAAGVLIDARGNPMKYLKSCTHSYHDTLYNSTTPADSQPCLYSPGDNGSDDAGKEDDIGNWERSGTVW
jgi:type II secretory pathway pseudopilin PulG